MIYHLMLNSSWVDNIISNGIIIHPVKASCGNHDGETPHHLHQIQTLPFGSSRLQEVKRSVVTVANHLTDQSIHSRKPIITTHES